MAVLRVRHLVYSHQPPPPASKLSSLRAWPSRKMLEPKDIAWRGVANPPKDPDTPALALALSRCLDSPESFSNERGRAEKHC